MATVTITAGVVASGGGGGGVCKRRVGSVGSGVLGPVIGLFYFRFSLTCNQVYAVIHVTKKGFYGLGRGGGGQ